MLQMQAEHKIQPQKDYIGGLFAQQAFEMVISLLMIISLLDDS